MFKLFCPDTKKKKFKGGTLLICHNARVQYHKQWLQTYINTLADWITIITPHSSAAVTCPCVIIVCLFRQVEIFVHTTCFSFLLPTRTVCRYGCMCMCAWKCILNNIRKKDFPIFLLFIPLSVKAENPGFLFKLLSLLKLKVHFS